MAECESGRPNKAPWLLGYSSYFAEYLNSSGRFSDRTLPSDVSSVRKCVTTIPRNFPKTCPRSDPLFMRCKSILRRMNCGDQSGNGTLLCMPAWVRISSSTPIWSLYRCGTVPSEVACYQGLQDYFLPGYVGKERALHVLGGDERVRVRAAYQGTSAPINRVLGLLHRVSQFVGKILRWDNSFQYLFRCMCDDHCTNPSQNLSSTLFYSYFQVWYLVFVPGSSRSIDYLIK